MDIVVTTLSYGCKNNRLEKTDNRLIEKKRVDYSIN